jgi:hypothetical protein
MEFKTFATYKATKANINRCWSCFQPLHQLFGRFVFRGLLQEAKSYNINERTPICRYNVENVASNLYRTQLMVDYITLVILKQ